MGDFLSSFVASEDVIVGEGIKRGSAGGFALVGRAFGLQTTEA